MHVFFIYFCLSEKGFLCKWQCYIIIIITCIHKRIHIFADFFFYFKNSFCYIIYSNQLHVHVSNYRVVIKKPVSWLILIIIKWLYHCHRRCCCCGQHICNVSRQRLVSRHPKTVREGMKTKDCVSPSLRTENQNKNGYDIQ